MTQIASLHNTRIKEIRALRQRKERERSGLFFVDGARAVAEALQLGAAVETLIIVPELLRSAAIRDALAVGQARGLQCLYVTAEVFSSLTDKETSGGIGAVVRQQWHPLGALRPGDGRCWVALEAVQYPGNLGTVLRTADAVGAGGVILLGNSADPYDPAAVRASTGAVFAQRLVRSNLADFAAWKRRNGVTLVGTSPAAEADYREIDYPQPLVLLMGSERYGLSAEMQALCDVVVRIPMVGRSDSLNLAVSTALLLYETFRRQDGLARKG